MAGSDDWRLTGQERYLQGVTLHRSRWVRPRPDWDHDHCAFCWAKFAEGLPGSLQLGYTTPNRYHWVCDQCFEHFKGRFEWHVAAPD